MKIKYETINLRSKTLKLIEQDPSGLNMTEDIQNRLSTFEADVDVRRIAQNMAINLGN